MRAEAIKEERAAPALVQVPTEGRTRPPKARILRMPGPEALLHPRAAEALVLAFRPLSWSR